MLFFLPVLVLFFTEYFNPAFGQPFSSYDQFRQAVITNFPNANPTFEQYSNFNQYARSHGDISTKEEAAMALAHYLHESWGLRLLRTCVPGTWPCVPCQNGDARCGKFTQSCDVPGKMYFGRGYIQLTWSCDNYANASEALFGDRNVLLNNPDRVSDDESVAWKTAFWYWKDRVQNATGVQQGQFGASTNAINGPNECGPNPQNTKGADTRFKYYKNIRKAWGLNGDGDPSGCR